MSTLPIWYIIIIYNVILKVGQLKVGDIKSRSTLVYNTIANYNRNLKQKEMNTELLHTFCWYHYIYNE